MSARLRRTARLLEISGRAVDAAGAALAEARGMLAKARLEQQQLESTWVRAAEEFATRVLVAGDLEAQNSHLRTLRCRADAAAVHVAKASEVAGQREKALLEASMERRKLELWQERMTKEQHEIGEREERAAADEVAARMSRGRP